MKAAREKRPSSRLRENLGAAKKLYYFILIVALFLGVTLIENDPAKLPALKHALGESLAYQRDEQRLLAAWRDLTNVSRGVEKEKDQSYITFYRDRPRGEGLTWLQLENCPYKGEQDGSSLDRQIARVWGFVESLKPEAGTVLSLETVAGRGDVRIPTEKPSLERQIAFIECVAGMVGDTLKVAQLRVEGTEVAGVGLQARLVPVSSSARSDAPSEMVAVIAALEKSSAFAKVAFATNSERLGSTYLNDLRARLGAVKQALIRVELWDRVNSFEYNRSLRADGERETAALVRNPAFFNEEALSRVVQELEQDISSRSEKLGIPLTAYKARIDVAVVLAGVILVALYLAYVLLLKNVSALARTASSSAVRFYPWIILWNGARRESHEWTTSDILRFCARASSLVHSFLGAIALGWMAIVMLRYGRPLVLEVGVAAVSFVLTAALGWAAAHEIRSIRAASE